MNAHAQITDRAPVTFDQHLADAWRGSMLEVADHIRFIRQHQKTIAERDEMLLPGVPVHRPAYVEAARALLAYRLPLYLEALRRVTEAEARMSLIGMPFAKSSDAWA